MKKILFSFILLISVFAFGHGVEFGVNAGSTYNNSFNFFTPQGDKYMGGRYFPFSINLSKDICFRWQAGVDLSIYSNIYGPQYFVFDGQISDTFYKTQFNTTSMIPSVYMNRKIRVFNDYIGAKAGIMYSLLNIDHRDIHENYDEYSSSSGYGYMLGTQVGYTHYFSKRFGANIEISPEYTNIRYNTIEVMGSNQNYKGQGLLIPFTIGLRCRL